MTNTAIPETQHSSPLCPKCDSEKVGFIDINELKCQCGHLFEPPEHLRGKGTPKAPHNRELDIVTRRKEDQFYWYLNDVLVEYSPGPRTFLQYREDYPNITINAWAKESELALYFYVERIQKVWRRYFNSPFPEDIQEELSDSRNVLPLFKEGPPIVLNQARLERFGKALAKSLPSRERIHLELSTLPKWLHLDTIRIVVRQITGEKWSKEKTRKLRCLKSDPKQQRGKRGRDSVFKYIGYSPPDSREKD